MSDTTPDAERPRDPVVVAAEAAARRFLADVRALPRHHPGCLCPLWNALEDAILLAVDERVIGHADALAVTDAVQALFQAMEGRREALGLDVHTVDGEPLPVAREPIFARVDVHFAGQVMPVKNALALAHQAAARSVAERELATREVESSASALHDAQREVLFCNPGCAIVRVSKMKEKLA